MYGRSVEVIESKKVMPVLKAIGILTVGYALYFLFGMVGRVSFYERGLVYKTLFSLREYGYETLVRCGLKYDDQLDYDSCGKCVLWYWFYKRFYRYYDFVFSDTKGFRLRPTVFADLDEKMEHFQENLSSIYAQKDDDLVSEKY